MRRIPCRRQRFPGLSGASLTLIDDNPMYIRDYRKCILCWRCVQVCAEDAQYTFAINFTGRGYETQIGTFFEKPMPETTCVFCGQCVGVCPTGALKPKREWLLEQGHTPDEIMSLTRSERRRDADHAGKGEGCHDPARSSCLNHLSFLRSWLQLQLHIQDDFIYQVTSPFDSVVNHGNLCVKGRFGYDFIYTKNRVTTPLIRKIPQKPGQRTQAFDRAEWREVSWDEALDYRHRPPGRNLPTRWRESHGGLLLRQGHQ